MEFAFGLPVLLIILLGCFDAARFVLINQKMA
ncbi:MAG: TadE/TadG family type IV pilus assembly protein, partial [Dongiaceae bacterium]